jgi:hypothetical protein
LNTVSRELVKYKFDLVGGREFRWDKGGTEPADSYTFFYVNGNAYHNLGTGFFVHKGPVSAIRRVEFVGDRMSYLTLRDRWCNIIVLNVHAPAEDKCGVIEDKFVEELERVFDQFLKYRTKIWLEDFNAKRGREDIHTDS